LRTETESILRNVVFKIKTGLWIMSKSLIIAYITPVRTSQETHHVSATKPNQLMLFRETVAVYCENHTEHTNTLCRQNAEL
jgi:hypothetical protein